MQLREGLGLVTSVLAVGAVALYLLGVVRTVGQLQASDVDVIRGMELVSVERHLRNGIGVVASPSALLFGLAYAGLYLWVRKGGGWTESERGPSDVGLSRRDQIYGWLVSAGVVILLVIAPWDASMFVVGLVFAFFLPTLVARRFAWAAELDRAVLYVTVNLVVGVVGLAVLSYFRSDPLPLARVVTQQRPYDGPLVAIDGGTVYLGATSAESGLFVVVGADQVQEVRVTARKRPTAPSLFSAFDCR